MKKRRIFHRGEFYLIRAVGVGREKIFRSNEDRSRFIVALEFYNSQEPVNLWSMFFNDLQEDREQQEICLSEGGKCKTSSVKKLKSKIRERRIEDSRIGGPKIAGVLGFVLLPRSYYLLLREVEEGGISSFMQKMGGYATYFNRRHCRRGVLFRSKYECVPVKGKREVVDALNYVHTRPVQAWLKKNRGASTQQALKKLYSYRYSSFLDYAGKRNFPSVTNRGFLLDYLRGRESYMAEVRGCVEKMTKKY